MAGELSLARYQELARDTDAYPKNVNDEAGSSGPQGPELSQLIPWISLAEETGVILRIFKDWQKYPANSAIRERLRAELQEKIGDVLWYAANLATKHDLRLEEIAAANLTKVKGRWRAQEPVARLDDGDSPHEQLPRFMRFYFQEIPDAATGTKLVILIRDQDKNLVQVGDRLDDNADQSDGYRFHDVFHMAYAAKLGWSPVLRALLRRKRKSNAKTDRVQDGARAQGLEEALTALIFEEASRYDFFRGVEEPRHVRTHLLKSIQRLVAGWECERCSMVQWAEAILLACRIFLDLREKRQGVVTLQNQSLTFEDLPCPEASYPGSDLARSPVAPAAHNE